MLNQQRAFFKESQLKEPNCCMLGISIVTLLDKEMVFRKNQKTGYSYYEGLKVYLDGDDEYGVSVGFNPFINKRSIIL